jgi:hypothetical protein
MAKIKSRTLSFPGSDSPDVVGYKLYIEDVAVELTYASPSFALGMETRVDLSTIAADKDGVFNIGVTAVDDAGNESDMSVLNNVPLDFMAPNLPGAVTVEVV